MKKLIFIAFQVHLALSSFSQDISAITESKTDIYCLGNVHFDGVYYKKNRAYRKEIVENEQKEAAIYKYLISTAGIETIALEFPVHNEPFLNYFFSLNQDSAVLFLDTINYPAYSYKLLRLRRLAHMFPELYFVCVDNAEEEDRFDFMNTLLYSIFSQYRTLNAEFMFADDEKHEVFVSAYNNYRLIIDSLSKEGYDQEYLNLLSNAVEVRFFKSCRKRQVRHLVKELSMFFKSKHPEYPTPFILRMCDSYITKKTKQKIERERFIFEEVTRVLVASGSTPVLLQLGKWHF